jgi:hypothetical protein
MEVPRMSQQPSMEKGFSSPNTIMVPKAYLKAHTRTRTRMHEVHSCADDALPGTATAGK